MRGIIIIFLLINFIDSRCQNLVVNPDFTEVSECPSLPHQIDLAKGWTDGGVYVNWTNFYHSCGSNFASLPYLGQEKCDFQEPMRGNGFAGIFVHKRYDYLIGALEKNMERGKSYFVEFYVVSDTECPSGNYSRRFTDAIGLAFTDTSFVMRKDRKNIPLIPAIENRGKIIEDTVNWMPVRGLYKAGGWEKNLFIGNFRNVDETMVSGIRLEVSPGYNYVYIDAVTVELYDPLPDTTFLCEGEQIEYDASFHDALINWSDGKSGKINTVYQPGKIIVEATIDDFKMYDTTVVVIADQYQDWVIDDVNNCIGDTVYLESPIPGIYEWNDGDTIKSKFITTSGNYRLSTFNDCGTFDFEVELNFEECTCPIYIPNVFTPNNDGINDFFEIFPSCDYDFEFNHLQIYDRLGGLLFESNEINDFWDGTANGKRVNMGVYVYLLNYSYILNEEKITKQESGSITLMR